jgi:hypothetical protein
VLSPDGARAAAGRPVLTALGGAVAVPAGGQLSADLSVVTDCDPAAVAALVVPVRAADGTVHALAVADGLGLVDQHPAPWCPKTPDALSAVLSGPLSNPRISVQDNTAASLRLSIDPGSPVTATTGDVRVHLEPDFPVVVAGGGTVVQAVELVVTRCPTDLSELPTDQRSPQVWLRGVPLSGDQFAAQFATLDLSPLLGAALQKACGGPGGGISSGGRFDRG